MALSAITVPGILGYVTPLSGQPGATLEFKISSVGGQPFRSSVVRIDCADPNPAGPGMQVVPIDLIPPAEHAGAEQATHSGSCAYGPLPPMSGMRRWSLELVVQPTLCNEELQSICCLQDEAGTAGWVLGVRDGLVVLHALDGAEVTTGLSLPRRCWTRVRLAGGTGASVRLSLDPVDALETRQPSLVEMDFDIGNAMAAARTICFGAVWRGHPAHCFNGLVEGPVLCADAQADASAEPLAIASWDFAGNAAQQTVPDAQAAGRALTLVNLPGRAVRSSAWTGECMDWRICPTQYAALYFRQDDLVDCGWDTAVALTIPAAMPSGVYGLVVDNGLDSDTIPFYVTPAPEGPRARILFLASTLTYQAYANHARGNFAGELEQRVASWPGAYPHNPDRVPTFGGSTYNRHADGSGIHISSRLRPMLTMRPGYLTFSDGFGSGLRHFPADSHLTAWLRAKGHIFDVITDEDLDDQGLASLQGYDVLMTGAHPEYHTRRMLDAILAYRAGGGNLMYLGANGFYWKIARNPAMPHVMEIRRAEGGIRAWASEPGEYYNQLDGEYGGMWRRNGIPPQKVGGVGFAVQGLFEGSYYKRTEASHTPELAWLFEGVAADAGGRIGNFGLSGGGAAGFELDQASQELGTQDHVQVVAVSEGHGPSFRTVPEEILTWTIAAGETRAYGGVSGHIVYGASPGAGGLFAVGSICFLGSLPHQGFDNNVSRLLGNCLHRFLSGP